MKKTLLGAAALCLLAGCGAGAPRATATPDRAASLAASTTLGRVVVYRNGVAYFERRAHVTGSTLVLSVRQDKIDDLLKSLSVLDLKTNQPAPVSYKTDARPGKDALVDMTITLAGNGPHDLLLSYVAEAPAWKPSYRVVMGQDSEIDLQGWTVIDNASGEDWNGVKVGVASSSALSYRHDMRSIRDVQRDTLRVNAPLANATALGPQPPTPPAAPAASGTEAIGSAHFESPAPLTVKRGSSAMISILHERTQGEFAYLYDPASPRPDAQFPFRVVRLKNPTASVLESGPVELFSEGRFIGEGLPEPIPARAVAFIPFALDRQVVVSRRPVTTSESIAKIKSVDHGLIQAEMRHAVTRSYTIKNRQSEMAVVYVRHLVTPGFKLTTPASEKHGDAQLFRITVDANQETELSIEEEAPVVRAIDVRTPGALEQVQAFLAKTRTDNPLRPRVDSLAGADKKVHEDEHRLAVLHREINAYAERANELKAQVAELRASRTGTQLQRELEKLLADIERAQSKATAESAALKDSLTVQRIAFHNAAAGLTVVVTENMLAVQQGGAIN